MTAQEVKKRLKDREFRLSLDFRPLDATELMAFEGLRDHSAEIAYVGDAVVISDHERGTYSVIAA